jgi:hypothetical protein
MGDQPDQDRLGDADDPPPKPDGSEARSESHADEPPPDASKNTGFRLAPGFEKLSRDLEETARTYNTYSLIFRDLDMVANLQASARISQNLDMVRKLQASSARISRNLDIVAKLPVSSAQISRNLDIVAKLQTIAQNSRNLDIVAKLQASSAQISRNLDIGPAFARIFDTIREKYPPNWPTDIDLERVTSVVRDDGLPIVWVPRAEIVKMLLAAEDRSARVDVLLGHIPELIADSRNVLSQVSHCALADQVSLASRAVEAFEDGHREAAQALAVTVTETAVARALGKKYSDVVEKVAFDPEYVTFAQLRLQAALAPIGSFYTPWYPSSGTPPPTALSRHVTVHQADLRHYTHENAIVAVLLVASVLRALQEFQELSDASEEDEQNTA